MERYKAMGFLESLSLPLLYLLDFFFLGASPLTMPTPLSVPWSECGNLNINAQKMKSGGGSYEVKFDGYRCLAGRGTDRATLWSRRGNLFTAQFPHIAAACERLPADTLLDGEIVAVDESGRISFNLLQHLRSKAQALLFYAFDVLIRRGKSLVNATLDDRRTALGEIFDKSVATLLP